MEGGTRHCRPFRLSKGVKKWRKASRKNTFGISLTPPTGGSADMVTRSAAPPPSPPKVNGPDVVWGVGALFPLWGGCGVLGFRV